MLDERVERRWAEIVGVGAIDVRPVSPAHGQVVRGLDLEVRLAAVRPRDRLRTRSKGRQVTIDGGGITAVVVAHDDDGATRDRLGVVRLRHGACDREDERDLVRRDRRVALDRAPDLVDRRRGVDAQPSMEERAERMKSELEGRHHAEVRARAPHPPEEVGLLGLGGPHRASIRGHELHGTQVVDGQAELPLEPAHPATERQPRDAGVADDADRADESVCLGSDIELAQQRATVGTGGALPRIDGHAAESGEVDDDAAVGGRVARGAVAARADGDLEVPIPTESDGRGHVVDARRADDDGRSPVEHRVPDPTRIVIRCMVRGDDLAPE